MCFTATARQSHLSRAGAGTITRLSMRYTGFVASQQGQFNLSKSEKGRLPHISAYRSFGLDVAVIEGGRACRIIQAKCRTDYSILDRPFDTSSAP